MAIIASAPAWFTALVGPYRTLRQVWLGYPAAAVPQAARTALLTLLLLAAVAAVTALTLGGERYLLAATLPPLACLALVVPSAIGAPEATSWVALGVALATGLGAALSPPTLPSAARLLRGTAGVVCAVTGAAGLAGSLATRAGTLAALGVLLIAAVVAAALGRDPAVRMVAWLIAAAAAIALPVTAFAAAGQPLRPAAFAVLAVCALLLAGAARLTRTRRPPATAPADLDHVHDHDHDHDHDEASLPTADPNSGRRSISKPSRISASRRSPASIKKPSTSGAPISAHGQNMVWREVKVNYADVTGEPGLAQGEAREEIVTAGVLSITQDWSLLGNFRYDLATDQTITDGLGLRYQDDCFKLDVTYQRSFIRDQDIQPDERFLVNLTLKYLGSYQSLDRGHWRVRGEWVRHQQLGRRRSMPEYSQRRQGVASERTAAGAASRYCAGLVVALLLAVFVIGAPAPGATQEVSIKILVNDDPISDYDIDQRERFLAITTQQQPSPALKKEATDMLIDERLQLQEGRKGGVTPDEDDVTKIIEDMAQKNKLTIDGLATALGQTGVNIKTLKDRIRAQLVWQETVRRKFGRDVQIGDADVTKAMSDAGEDGGGAPAESALQLRQVKFEIPAGADQKTIAARLAAADDLRARFASCAELAKGITGASVKTLQDQKPDF